MTTFDQLLSEQIGHEFAASQQYIAIAAELRALLHAPSVLALVPAVRALQRELVALPRAFRQLAEASVVELEGLRADVARR